MKQNPLILPIVGGGIALLCFFFPWIKIDMSSLGLDPAYSNLQGTATISGLQYVIGGSTFEILTFLAALVILGVCFYMLTQKTPWKSRIPVLICSGFGFLYFFIALIRFIIQYNLMVSRMLEYAPPKADIGKFASIIALVSNSE